MCMYLPLPPRALCQEMHHLMCVMFYGLFWFDLICYRAEGSVPYLIPVGGSNAIGVWGYIEAFREMVDQVRGKLFLLNLIHSSIDTLSGLLHELLLYIAYYALWDVGLSYGVLVHRAFWSILMILCCLQEEVVRCVELPSETTLLDQKWSQLMPV